MVLRMPWEVVCKTVAKATVVRIHHPPHARDSAPDQYERGQASILLVRSGPAESGYLRLFTGT